LINELPRSACIDFLQRIRYGRLACEQAGQPYVTPLYFACHEETLYAFSTLGQKIAWMRANPRVCLEADEVISPQNWTSVVAFGRYEELPAGALFEAERNLAHSLLSRRPIWWEPGYARTLVREGNERPLNLVYFRLHIGHVTGHRGSAGRPSSTSAF